MSQSPFGPQGPQLPQAPQTVQQTIVVNQGAVPSQALPALVNFFCFPGLGQLIQGRPLAALIWWTLHGLAAASCLVLVGFVLWPIVWIACVIDAARYNPLNHQGEQGASKVLAIGVGVFGLLVFFPILLLIVAAVFAPTPEPIATLPTTPPALGEIELPSENESSSGPSGEAAVPEIPGSEPMIDPVETTSPGDPIPLPDPAPEIVIPEGPTIEELEQAAKEEAVRKEADRLSKIEAAKWRVWKSASGSFSTEAKFLSFGAGKVTLEKRDGKVITVDLSLLSQEDESFIRNKDWLKAGSE